MEFLLICGIVVGAFVIVAYRIARTLREPVPPCCNCDTCMQPEEVRNACCSDNPQSGNTKTSPSNNNDSPPENGAAEER